MGGTRWRVVDIVVAAIISITGAVTFMVWTSVYAGLSVVGAAWPPLNGLWVGVWLLPGVLGALIIRKPGAALFCELFAAAIEMFFGTQWGLTVLYAGLMQGLGAELGFLIFRYRYWRLPAALLSGGLAGLFAGINESFFPWGYNLAFSPENKVIYICFVVISGVVLAGALAWLTTRALAKTGALSALKSRDAATEKLV